MPNTSDASPESTVERVRAKALRDGSVQNYRVEDFCAVFGISRRTAWQLISDGHVEALKVGRRTLITAESAAAWRDRCPRVSPART